MTAAELKNTPPDSPPDRPLIAGRYRLQARIGHGRLGDIFSAIDTGGETPGVERHVAVQLVSDVVARNNKLFNKIRIGYESLHAAAHPNIIKYHSFGRDNKHVYLVMDLVEGGSLDLLLSHCETLPIDEVRPVLRGVGEALQLLHANDLVHGNLTASNVFITDKLDVQLLDVVPIAAANAFFPGTAMSQASRRSTVADDVFALACLVYYMLVGKHPFNHNNPGAARIVGIEPDRIASLSDSEWDALRRALALDGEQRTTSVAEFMRDFGVRGTESLRPSIEHPVAEEQPAPPWPTVSQSEAEIAEPAIAVATDSLYVDSWPDEKPVRGRPGAFGTVLLGALLAGLAAWWFYGQPEERFIDLFAYIDESINTGPAGQSEEPGREASLPVAAAPADTNDTAFVDATAERPGAEQPLSELPEPTWSEPAVKFALAGSDPMGPIKAAEVPASTAPAAVAEEPESVSTESVVTVSEQNGAAKIWMRREGDSKLPLVWWTSENTARADADYVAVTEQVVDLAPGETLHIPLVDDNVPEQRESFFVDFGVRQPEGQIRRVASVRVDIEDDDLP